MVGHSNSDAFPTTPGAFQETAPDATASGSDPFVLRMSEDGSELDYSTFLGGHGSESAHGIDVHDGSAIVAGFTEASDFPTTPGSFQSTDPEPGSNRWDGFVTRLNGSGSGLDWGTYVGAAGPHLEGFLDVAVADDGTPTATGYTGSQSYPTTPGAFQEDDPDLVNEADGIVTSLAADGSELEYSTYLGGSRLDHGRAVGIGADGDLFVAGLTSSSNFPTTDGAFQSSDTDPADYEAFVTRIHPERDDPDPRVPTTLELAPDTVINTVGTQHCVTATVRDQDGNAYEGVAVWFSVSGASETGGGSPTDAEGRAQFCYDGPPFPGEDAITAFADTDGDAEQDEGEPSDSAAKSWVLASGGGGCKVTGGGTIVAANGDKATFAIGGGTYVDHGPAAPLKLKSLRELVVICSPDGDRVTIYGEARVEGQGTRLYRIEVTDRGEPGTADTYSILLDTGYSSGDRPLSGGNIQIR